MTFLYDDKVLLKLLIDSGAFDKVSKYAQYAQEQAKQLALQLAQDLLSSNSSIAEKTPDLYVKDLVDLDSYLNFLLKNNTKAQDGKFIVINQGNAPSQDLLDSIDKKIYTLYKSFWIHKQGLSDLLYQLNVNAQLPGNEVMKPLVKKLFEQTNQLGVKFDNMVSKNPYEEDNETKKQPTSNVQVPFGISQTTADDAAGQNSDTKSDKDQANNASQAELENALNNLPFKHNGWLSPYDMQSFIINISRYIHSNPKLNNSRLGVEFTNYLDNMNQNVGLWNSLINKVSAEISNSNAKSYRLKVPYDLSQRPTVVLEQIFGSTPNARSAAQILLTMVNLMEQSFDSLRESTVFSALISQDKLNSQINQAQSYANSLGPFAR